MDGKLLTLELRNLLNEEADSALLDSFTTFNFLNEAANAINMRIEHIKNSQSITSVADQAGYTLDARFMKLYLKNRLGRHFVQYSDGTTKKNVIEKSEDSIISQTLTESVTSVDMPDNFYITDDTTLDDQVTGTTTSAGALSAGKATLTDTAADFSDVSAGDNLHNTDDDSIGIVISKTSSTVLVTALFGGENNDYTSGDAYVIQPQGRYKITLSPPPSGASDTITVPYVSRLAPVYSDYDHFRLPIQYKEALLSYAAYKYKQRSKQFKEANEFFTVYDNAVRRAAHNTNRALGRNRVITSFKKREVRSQF